MDITGSCYCGRVKLAAVLHTPYPYMRCYCTMCGKTAGGGGCAINIMAQADTFELEGEEHVALHENRVDDDERPGRLKKSSGEGYYCQHCGSALWASDPAWPEWVYPFASAIDNELPKPPVLIHIMLDFAAPWVEVPRGEEHRHFNRYPKKASRTGIGDMPKLVNNISHRFGPLTDKESILACV